MGFQSPAQDYVESRIDLNNLFILHPSATFLIERGNLSYVVDSSLNPAPGDEVCYELFGEQGIGKMMGRAIITPDGDAIEGSVLDDLLIHGVVVLQVMKVWDDRLPF
ncbi:phage repressor protein [Erwinia sp. ACCC 02193]|uniref:Phage repressor protein n=1 Tax=Erwinia aeris TaxID=3239803 RepID=A0ABV4E2C0_9GAMM